MAEAVKENAVKEEAVKEEVLKEEAAGVKEEVVKEEAVEEKKAEVEAAMEEVASEEAASDEAVKQEINIEKKKVRHRGRGSQTFIYLGKLFRMFIFQNDWKVLPMAAIIAALVAYVVGRNLFKTMEGTLLGTFAMSCICIWNGFFNSIQSVCRERPILKREHRSGLHISSYIAAHMIYQAFLCLCQTVITILVLITVKVTFPDLSLFTGKGVVDIGITLFLTTYCADMMSLMVSSLVRSTTAAMTIMPFLLIFQLVFSGGFFALSGVALKITNLTVAKWGLTALCAQADYNGLPMVSVWNNAIKMKDYEVDGVKPLQEVLVMMEETDMKDQVMMESGKLNQKPEFESSVENVLKCWFFLILFSLVYAAVAVISLEFIDRDKR